MKNWSEDWLDFVLNEDIGDGDHSSLACISADSRSKAVIIAKEDGIIAGLEEGQIIFGKVDSKLEVSLHVADGDQVRSGDRILSVRGSSRSILTAERTVLNVMQRMSGIATTTRNIVDKVSHSKAKILDTRKTTPGMRILEKKAVKLGGGENHRIGLYDMVMIKDNHVDFCGSIEAAISRSRAYLDSNNLDLKIEVEVRNMDEVRQVIEAGGVDRIMLDNFSVDLLKEAVQLIDGKIETEASGGITIDSVASYAETGVDFISMGALTHSVKSMDLSLKADFE